MELIPINEKKLKIILSQQDMEEYNIDTESFDYSNVSTKKVFWEILEYAKANTGFNADNSKLFVQVFPASDGGCEMFVTKYSKNSSRFGKNTDIEDINANDFIKKSLMLVSSYENIAKLCKRLEHENNNFNSSLFIYGTDTYILILKKNNRLPSYHHYNKEASYKSNEYIYEYGKVIELSDTLEAQINEHCRLLIDNNAISILSSIGD